ncbi:MAG TPA: hypothetical protein VFU19_10140 [Iamia sp.]|nr:hypothetical protein [Iamia sp.]
MSVPARRGLLLVALVLGVVVGVHVLRQATMSTHYSTAPDSRLVVVIDAAANRSEPGVEIADMVDAQVDVCGLEVARVPDITPVAGTDDHFTVTVQPALDSTDRKQLRGCLEDWAVDHLRLEVRSMEDEVVEEEAGGAG